MIDASRRPMVHRLEQCYRRFGPKPLLAVTESLEDTIIDIDNMHGASASTQTDASAQTPTQSQRRARCPLAADRTQ